MGKRKINNSDMNRARYNRLKKILQQRKLFKLVCGAGNEDPEEVKRLAFIFTLAGSTMLDLSANADIVDAAAEGIRKAYEIAPLLGRDIRVKPYLNVSIGLKGDPHVRKAQINLDNCSKCGLCITVCQQKAISDDCKVVKYRCIGCGHCETICPKAAIQYISKRLDFNKILPLCIQRGVETLELHAAIDDDKAFLADWKIINNLIQGNFISLCIDRSLLSDEHLIDRIKMAYVLTGERLIIQADGIPMSGSENDDYNNTLQAIACADIVGKSKIPVKIVLSGGTNRKTGLLAKQCAVGVHGVAIGSFARKIVKEFISQDKFYDNKSLIKKAVSVADELIRVNLEAIGD
ncbi:MAG: LdpA C-terminal domain-containing domain [Candidatus Omnitrophica bacterium]|nr:LdpA C-terminal domain-containing domain [Candidatus Omnitrophota bacterium]